MSDESVRDALRSGAQLVVIEAPAGCGKTHQGADYVADIIRGEKYRTLILTHTHAACSVFAERTQGLGSLAEIRTIDSLVVEVASVYHAGLGLPADPALWARRHKAGYAEIAARVAKLLARYPMIARGLARRYPVIVCDEHQDSTGDQHAIVMSIYGQGSKLRIFADPVQKIFRDDGVLAAPFDFQELERSADRYEELDQPHRWADGCPRLGRWTLDARRALKAGGKVDLRAVPPSVRVLRAENIAQARMDFRLAPAHGRVIRGFYVDKPNLLILTPYNQVAHAIRSMLGRTIPLWEGYVRSALDQLVNAIDAANGSPEKLAKAVMAFVDGVAVGFSPSSYGRRFEQEARDGCKGKAIKKPALIQQLARCLVEQPDHRGISAMLVLLYDFVENHPAFAEVKIDGHREYRDAMRLGSFATADEALADFAQRRSYIRPQPPARAISTIHKAKGLQCESVLLMPCSAINFPDRWEARCLLYVALSRAKKHLMIVASEDTPSPLFIL